MASARQALHQEHARQMFMSLGAKLVYFEKLKTRLAARGIGPMDPLYLEACRVYEAVHALRMAFHYLSLDPGQAGEPTLPK